MVSSLSFMMDPTSIPDSDPSGARTSKKLRLACDACHKAKVRCCGRDPCERCKDSNTECKYSFMAKLGKPKGSRNKKTLEKLAPRLPSPNDHKCQAVSPISPEDTRVEDVEFQFLGSQTALRVDFLPNTLNPGYYTVQPEDPNPPPSTGDILPPNFDAQKYQSKLVHLPRNADESMVPADVPALNMMETWMDIDWRNMLTMGAKEKQTYYPDEACNASATSGDLPLSLESDSMCSNQTCLCFKDLTDHLSDLNVIERNQKTICSDLILFKTDVVLSSAESVLACNICRLDSKILLLLMTVLQTVLNWIRVEYSQDKAPANMITPIFFGNWKVPQTDCHLIKALLINRIIDGFESLVNVLRLRMNEIALGRSKASLTYQYMDSESLQHTLQRLNISLRDLSDVVRPIKVPNQDPQGSSAIQQAC